MTPDQLTEALDATAMAAGDNQNLMPWLVTVKDVEWGPTFISSRKSVGRWTMASDIGTSRLPSPRR
jgi:hypothetical protein